MTILKAMAVRDVEKVARAIPVIDFGAAFRDELGWLEAVARRVRSASQEIGRIAAPATTARHAAETPGSSPFSPTVALTALTRAPAGHLA